MSSLAPWAERSEIGGLPCWVGGAGPALVYLHSRGGWQSSGGLRRLAAARRLYMPVFPGFDGTPARPGVDSPEALADLTAAFITAAGIGPCPVVGLSFGTRAAAWTALRHPALVEQMVLESPTFSCAAVGGARTGETTLYAYPERREPASEGDEARKARNRMVASGYASDDSDARLAAAVGGIGCSTLILHGVRDTRIPPAAVQEMKHRIRQSFLYYVYDAAHVIESDQPERFGRLVGDFLECGDAFIVPRAAAAQGA